MPDEPMILKLDPERLTLGQIEQLEDATGQALNQLLKAMADGNYTAKMTKALVWVLRSAEDPTFTLEDAANIPLGELAGMVTVAPKGDTEEDAAASV